MIQARLVTIEYCGSHVLNHLIDIRTGEVAQLVPLKSPISRASSKKGEIVDFDFFGIRSQALLEAIPQHGEVAQLVRAQDS